ncbi:MAG: molecular chaperone DnaJ [Candidatus Omnitrophica bacterium]|nr:molecular chaperone DnaJ [Candidatus Omnitrophota bacterium]MBD3269638.1 molecular chaperone DnaJ [Candidatus Omnitrophota bacterium]
MSTKKDYYDILGVPKGTGVDEIKKIYRQLVMKHHPDRVPEEKKKEAEERFKEISEAYAVLSDPKKKELYDKYGHAGIDSRYTTEDIFRGADFSDIFGGGGGFGDIFENIFSDFGFDIFGGGRSRRRSARMQHGEDLQLQTTISLKEAALGAEKNVSYYRYEACDKCSGTGAAPGSKKITCPTCKGAGSVRSGMGFISIAQTCPNCKGSGQIIQNPCRNCSGQGRVRLRKNLKINIPKGVDTGSVLRLKDEGNYAPGGRGDLYLYIAVEPHPVFKRDGDNLRCKVKIGVVKAVLGTEIEVPTLTGRARMKVPPGTQSQTVFRLKNKGISNLRSKHTGDELVEVEIEVPRKLSSRQKKLYSELDRL